MRIPLTFAFGLIIGAGLNEYAAKKRHEGIYEGLLMTNRIMVDEYLEFAAFRADQAERHEAIRLKLCAWPFTRDNIIYLQKRGEIEGYC
jgi:hypothetical protein